MTSPIASSAREFSEHNQRGLAWALKQAYAEADAETDLDRHPMYATPLRPIIRGSVRWNHVQASLKLACETGRIVGFAPVWRPTGGKAACNQVLELVGANCALTAVHVGEMEETPRDAAFRRDARGSNQLLLESIEDQMPKSPEVSGRINLLLVHGGHDFDFAEIRCYNGGEEDRSAYETVVANIERWRDDEDGGTLAWADEEPITPPTVTLRTFPGAQPDVMGK